MRKNIRKYRYEYQTKLVSSFLLSLADGWRTDIDVEFPIVITDIGLYFGEIRHCERHEISWHQQGRSKMIPIEIFHSIPDV